MTTFEPAAWMAKMEGGGHTISIWNGGILHWYPQGPRSLSYDEETELYRVYRGGDKATVRQKYDALWDYLEQTGRVAEPGPRALP
ncbi:MAG: hypothetical protein O7B98_07530 [Alphaproteobacteria bacterium]|nr:hypothetical protein [Alphaproteobacteria bacterium]